VNRKQRATKLVIGQKNKAQDRMWKHTHTLSSDLPRSYECSTYTAGGNWWPCENQKNIRLNARSSLLCSGEGVAWKAKYGG
jgi:hypothetical protein